MNSMTLMRLEEACTNKSKNCDHAFGSTTKTCRPSFWKQLRSKFTALEEFSKVTTQRSPFLGAYQEMLQEGGGFIQRLGDSVHLFMDEMTNGPSFQIRESKFKADSCCT